MRVLHLIDERWDSGISQYAIQIGSLLNRHGDDVTVGVEPSGKPARFAREAGLRTVPVGSYWNLRSLLRKDSFDLINVHTGKTHTWSVLCKMEMKSRLRSVPIVRTRGDARPLKGHLASRFVYQHTTGVIAASDHIRRQYELHYGLNELQLRTIYPSVVSDDSIRFFPQKKVGILARLDPVKGHSTFLESAAHVLKSDPNVQFLIAGREANLSYQLLKNQARALGIERSVQFLGFAPSAEEFMRKCSFGVVASLGSEEVSRVCLEWMGHGRAVVGTLVGCLPELIEPSETGLLVPPKDAHALGEAIKTLAGDPKTVRQWGRNANQVAALRFNSTIFLEKTRRMYHWAVIHARA